LKNQVTLEKAVEEVLKYLEAEGHTKSYLIDTERKYKRLIKLAKQEKEIYFSESLASLFLKDDKHYKTGKYCHNRFLAHNRCIRFLRNYLKTGQARIEKYHVPIKTCISSGFLEALNLYDKREEDSGLSKSSLIKNRRPIRYLLEYMTSIGYQHLADIQFGDTTNAIVDMLNNHYAPTSLVTAISGMRRFYSMFSELKPFQLEIPSRLPRKHDILDVYSEEEQEKISTYLNGPNLSRRDTAICLLSFETGLRNVDICNLKLGDIDWKHNAIHIVQSKTQKPLNLPLRTSYGNAMVEYLLNERPNSDLDYFFLSMKAPYTKMNTTWNIVKKAVTSAGVNTNENLTGTRMFRHNVASSMLKKGIPLSVISEELGHSSQDATMIYLSTDQDTMAALTLPIPKGGTRLW